MVGPGPAAAQDAAGESELAQRLYQQVPHDLVILNDEDQTSLRVELLDFPDRRIPASPRPTAKLKLNLLDEPYGEYEVRWRDIAQIVLFEQLLLEEAASLVAEEKYDEAFDYYLYLRKNRPEIDGLEAALQQFLVAEARARLERGDHERARLLMIELLARNPDHPDLASTLGASTDALIEAHVSEGRYPIARRMLAELAGRFPQETVVLRWQQRFADQAAEHVAAARAALTAGQLAQAHEAARRAVEIWPLLEDARNVVQEVHARYPVVSVGVGQLSAADTDSVWLADWAARRTRRLVARGVAELRGIGSEGGQYASPWGTFESAELGRGLTLVVRPDAYWADGTTPLLAADVARRLLTMCRPGSDDYDRQLARVVEAIAVPDVDRLDIRLRRAHVRPEALLRAAQPIKPLPAVVSGATDIQFLTSGPYGVASRSEDEMVFEVASGDAAGAGAGPSRFVERRHRRSAHALQALQRGEVAIVDRINPWEIDQVAAKAELNVRAYSLPTIHCLIPNFDRPLSGSRSFRRAMVYAIDRQRILQTTLLQGREDPGSLVLSGPFVRGATFDDPRGYAYNTQVETRPFDPHMALTLAAVGIAEAEAAYQARGQELPDPLPLTMAHPADEIAQASCEVLAEYVSLLGVEVELVELSGPVTRAAVAEHDFVYTALALWEPVVDAWELLGPDGLANGASSYIELALRRLTEATDWPTARQRLLELHRLAHDDVAVIPLYQLTEHFAYHSRVSGMAGDRVSLYQDIESWRVAPWMPTDEP